MRVWLPLGLHQHIYTMSQVLSPAHFSHATSAAWESSKVRAWSIGWLPTIWCFARPRKMSSPTHIHDFVRRFIEVKPNISALFSHFASYCDYFIKVKAGLLRHREISTAASWVHMPCHMVWPLDCLKEQDADVGRDIADTLSGIFMMIPALTSFLFEASEYPCNVDRL